MVEKIIIGYGLIALLSFVSISEGVKCFMCEGNGNCHEEKNNKFRKCNGEMCSKEKKWMNDLGTYIFTKNCKPKGNLLEGECTKTTNTDNADMEDTMCTCVEDDCNHAAPLRSPKHSILAYCLVVSCLIALWWQGPATR